MTKEYVMPVLTAEGKWLTEQELRERFIAGFSDDILAERDNPLTEEWVTLKDGRRINVGDGTSGSSSKKAAGAKGKAPAPKGKVIAKTAAKTAAIVASPAIKQKIATIAKAGFNAMKTDERMLKTIEGKKNTAGVLMKSSWFAKRLGEMMEAYSGFTEFAHRVINIGVKLAKAASGLLVGHHALVALHSAVIALHPIVTHLVTLAAAAL
jgi:hypothetical protein